MQRAFRHQVGTAEVQVLWDGETAFGPELFPGTDAAHIEALVRQAQAPAIQSNFNAALIRTGGRVVLADAGPRDLFGPTCGFLPQALAEAGATAAEVDTLFATHMHPDHVAGLITPQGAPVFAKAELVVTQAEHAFWTGAGVASLPDPIPGWAALAQAVFAAYGDRLRLIGAEGAIAPGLTAVSLPGHTPGHSGWRLDDGGQALLHVGDIIHAPALQAADPDIAIVFDIDTDTARATRKRVLDMAASDGMAITGGHFLAPKVFVATRRGAGYALDPA